MKQKTWVARLIPHVIAIVIFLVLTFICFKPVFLDSKVLFQSDIMQFKGFSREVVDYRNATGHEALWTNSMFGGMPAYQISTEYKGNLLRYVDDILTLRFILPHPSENMFLLLLGFYILLITLGVDVWLSIAGAIGFAFASFDFILLGVGHNSEVHALAYLPICMAGILMIFRRNYLAGGAITGVAMSLELLSNHLQIAYYFFLITLIFIGVEFVFAIKEKTYKHFITSAVIVGVAAVFAVLTNLSLLWTTYDYGKETIRGKSELTSNKKSNGGLDEDYAFGWSYGKMETMTLLIPDAFGGSDHTDLSSNSNMVSALKNLQLINPQFDDTLQGQPTYWGAQPFTEGPVYLGAIFCFLFVLGCFLVKGPIKWWLLIASTLAIILSWGHNFLFFNDLMFKYFPGLNKFRTVTMALIIPQFTFPLMSILVLKQIISGEVDKTQFFKFLKISLYIVGGLALLTLLIGPSLADFKGAGDDEVKSQWVRQFKVNEDGVNSLYSALKADRASLMRMDAFRSLVFVGLIFGLLFFFYKGKIKKGWVSGILIVLVFADLFFVGARYLTDDNYVDESQSQQNFNESPADQSILRDKSLDYRVLNLSVSTFNDGYTSYYHESVGGYSAAKLRRYQELIDNAIEPQIDSLAKAYGRRQTDLFYHTPVLNMLNDKYVIGSPNAPAIPNADACGNVWFVNSYTIVPNADAEIAAIKDFNPKQVCFIDKRFANQLNGVNIVPDSSSTITLQSYQPNDLVYQSSNKNTGVAVFSEIYYANGWNAYVDGKQMPYFRCDYVLRGMVLPAGNHKIEFRFEPVDYNTGEKVALASSVLLILVVLGALVKGAIPAKKE